MSGTAGQSVQAGRIEGDVHFHGSSRRTARARRGLWLALGLVLVTGVGATWWGLSSFSSQPNAPLSAEVHYLTHCPGGDWVFPHEFDTSTLPAPDSLTADWAYARGGAAATAPGGMLELTLLGRSADSAVVLNDMRARIVSRNPTATDGVLVRTCTGAGDMWPRSFDLDLDNPAAGAVPKDGDEIAPGDGLVPAADFPYRVSATDPEVFYLFPATTTCACRWQLELDWTSKDGAGTLVLDMHGKPFRTTAIRGLSIYNHSNFTNG